MKQVSCYHPFARCLTLGARLSDYSRVGRRLFLASANGKHRPKKIGVLRVHMAGGTAIFVLMVVRLVIRLCINPAISMFKFTRRIFKFTRRILVTASERRR